MSGFKKVVQDTRSVFRENLKSLRMGRKEEKMMNWAEELESSQKTQDGVEDTDTSHGKNFIPSAYISDDDDDKSSVAESSNLEESTHDDKVSPSPLPLTSATTPHVVVMSEAELYKLKAQEELAVREVDPFQTGAPMTESQFNAQIDAGKEKAGDIVDEEIRSIRRRLNYRHTAKMAQATDLPIELIDLILSFLPPNHAEQVQWRRAAAAIGREARPVGWNLSDHQCRRCGRVCLAMWDHEERKEWVIQRWGYWGPRQWALAGFFILCPCDAMLGNYFGVTCDSSVTVALTVELDYSGDRTAQCPPHLLLFTRPLLSARHRGRHTHSRSLGLRGVYA
ncbi:hypothetical protein AGABI2DRAFT_140729 [Agaricus bisporus var. bisporus H97]|uniref:hypothetical protein n=1 Tax=Agaricus bisporus var. bisporus (strain H97 / ATCC MYA-4626 / FGSC 10389) TaxID=936046 RepID=UPI00029F4F41|nr:hypothetical protein AGABI2DRAFT_140729 [Agaricus bisporus var. bisporus H97]EKV51930.1 hypothetical protein AGABI2DRAFT_140729 [Agaricus bisporus var. bisporus H97]